MSHSLLKAIAILSATLCLATTSAAAATVIFEDTFDRPLSDTVGNGWSEFESDADRVGINSEGRLRLRGVMDGIPDAAAGSPIIDATGYTNITVSFAWRIRTSNDAQDLLHLSFAQTPLPSVSSLTGWIEVFADGADVTGDFEESVMLTGAANSSFGLLFWTNEAVNPSGFTIREVTVTGDRIAVVPVPAALPLLLFGLGALVFARRRKVRG